MLTVPTIIKNSTLKDCKLGVFVTNPLHVNSILIEENGALGVIELSQKQFNNIMFDVSQIEDTEQKNKLLDILNLFDFSRTKASLIISNLAYMNTVSIGYNVQYINGILYAIKNIEAGEELLCNSAKIWRET
jgi:hypothetical protein